MMLTKTTEEKNLEYVLMRYKKGEITIGKAAELAKKDLREMVLIAAKKKIPFQYSKKELMEDFEAAKNG